MVGASITDLKSKKIYDLTNGPQIFDLYATILRKNAGVFS